MKKLFLASFFALLSLCANADDFIADGICYNITGDNTVAVVSKYNGKYAGDIVIPNNVIYGSKEYSVTSIGGSAFWCCSGLTSINIPEGVTSIGQSAFWGCSGLTSINIPEGVTSIGQSAFGGCSSLTSINIPKSVTSIGDVAFSNCSGLTAINIPKGVTSIGYDVFYGCSGLTAIVVADGNSVYDSRNNCNAIIRTSDNCLIRGCRNTVIPVNVTSIGEKAFGGCSTLTAIDIPKGVTSIGSLAFCYCSGLTSIDIPESVTSIGGQAFYHCSSLTSIVVADGNSVYDSRNNCNAIIRTSDNCLVQGCQNTVIPVNVTSIGEKAFGGCSTLTAIDIPKGVTSIGNYAFEGCSSLTSINIPKSVKSIGNYAFYGCI